MTFSENKNKSLGKLLSTPVAQRLNSPSALQAELCGGRRKRDFRQQRWFQLMSRDKETLRALGTQRNWSLSPQGWRGKGPVKSQVFTTALCRNLIILPEILSGKFRWFLLILLSLFFCILMLWHLGPCWPWRDYPSLRQPSFSCSKQLVHECAFQMQTIHPSAHTSSVGLSHWRPLSTCPITSRQPLSNQGQPRSHQNHSN